MRARVVIDEPCPQCGGKASWPGVEYAGHDGLGGCITCFCTGTVTRTLATLPDRAELEPPWDESDDYWGDGE